MSKRESLRILTDKNDLDAVKENIKALQAQQRLIIYPGNRYIRYWDGLMLTLLTIYSFIVPYQLGVSAGSNLLQHPVWFGATVFMNTCFLIDTFLPFFRAFRDHRGRMVIDPPAISREYLRSYFWPNLLSNLPTTVVYFWYGREALMDVTLDLRFFSEEFRPLVSILKLSDLLKLLRLGRARRLLSRSDLVRQIREKVKPYTIRFVVFCFMLLAAAHWFACIWVMVAYLQVGTFNKDDMLSTPNWIGYWYDNNYVPDGGINPIGWANDVDRYALAFYWACQTITSIGYGNVAPLTRVEWWMGSVLQLAAGILWAYVIGGLVGVVTAMEVKGERFRERIDEANTLIEAFLPEEGRGLFPHNHKHKPTKAELGTLTYQQYLERRKVAKRIRKYVYAQNDQFRSTARFRSELEDKFPILETLSPQLQRSSMLMVYKMFLEKVPYLSSKFLSFEEQSLVARQCMILEFPAEEVYHMDGVVGHDNHDEDEREVQFGRGILIQKSGILWRSSSLCKRMNPMSKGVVGDGSVLLEDSKFRDEDAGSFVRFMTFSTILFVPRSAVLSALARNPQAWAESARWKYLAAALVQKAKDQKKPSEGTGGSTRVKIPKVQSLHVAEEYEPPTEATSSSTCVLS
eukprot:Nitzschia sp. Nitz4//scaffold185_size43419//2298//4187//NITZ4_007292-RA/size43419-processed-gene-0.78-mRNA-1//-1//CDS//3329539682//4056//frame0